MTECAFDMALHCLGTDAESIGDFPMCHAVEPVEQEGLSAFLRKLVEYRCQMFGLAPGIHQRVRVGSRTGDLGQFAAIEVPGNTLLLPPMIHRQVACRPEQHRARFPPCVGFSVFVHFEPSILQHVGGVLRSDAPADKGRQIALRFGKKAGQKGDVGG